MKAWKSARIKKAISNGLRLRDMRFTNWRKENEMGCDSRYLEPRPDEAHRQLTAQLLLFAYKELGIEPKPSLIVDATNSYLNEDYTEKLCWLIKTMTPAQREQVVYNGRNPMSRKLADWWDAHQENDQKRKNAEEIARSKRINELEEELRKLKAQQADTGG